MLTYVEWIKCFKCGPDGMTACRSPWCLVCLFSVTAEAYSIQLRDHMSGRLVTAKTFGGVVPSPKSYASSSLFLASLSEEYTVATRSNSLTDCARGL